MPAAVAVLFPNPPTPVIVPEVGQYISKYPSVDIDGDLP
jgi:hypothetical protein